MAKLKYKTGGSVIEVGGPGTPATNDYASKGSPNTFTAANTFTADQTFTANLLPVGTGTTSIRIGANAAANVSGNSAIGIGGGAVSSASSTIAIGTSSTASSSSTIAIGASSTASGALSIAIGPDATASGASQAVAVGRFARALGTQTTVVGGGAVANGVSQVIIGFGALGCLTETGAVVVGMNAAIGGNDFTDGVLNSTTTITSASAYFTDIDVGLPVTGTGIPGGTTIASVTDTTTAIMSAAATATASGVAFSLGRNQGAENVAVGHLAHAQEWRATVVGFKSFAALSATAIGRGCRAQQPHDIAMGRGAWTPALASGMSANAALGFTGASAPYHVYFNSGHTHKYTEPFNGSSVNLVPSTSDIVIHGFDAFDATASPTNNVAGGPLVLAAGRGTGTAAGGSVSLQVAPAGGASNNTKNTLVKVIEVGAGGAGGTLAFFAGAGAVKQTGVAVTAAGIHAALVAYGLIAA